LGVGGNVSFLVDTGADKTVVMPLDGRRLGIDYAALRDPVEALGIGGASTDYEEDAALAFADGEYLYVYRLVVHIATPIPEISTVPSLLGRDVLDNWTITFDKPHDSLTMIVVRADSAATIRTRS
jgi:hypothetical protein